MYWEAQGVRYRLTLEKTMVMNKMVWVMEREHARSLGEGQHRVRHCRVAPGTNEGLAQLLALAGTERIWG